MSAESLIEDIITNAQALATTTTQQATAFANDAQTAALSVVDLGALPVPVKPHVTIPAFVPGTSDIVSEFIGKFDQIYGTLNPEFTSRFNGIISRFFPKVETCLASNIDDWLCDVIANGGTGIPADIEDQLWERSRSRELKDLGRQDDEVVGTWAERGFSLPTGALFDAQQKLQQDATDKISTHSRDVAIKQIEIEIANIRFAVEQGIRLRLGAVDAASKYVSAWLEVGQTSVAYTNGIMTARLGLYQAVTAYYNSLISAETLTYAWGKDQTTHAVQAQTNFVDLVKSNTAARVQAAVSAATTVGSIGAAAVSAQNSMANIGNNTFNQV